MPLTWSISHSTRSFARRAFGTTFVKTTMPADTSSTCSESRGVLLLSESGDVVWLGGVSSSIGFGSSSGRLQQQQYCWSIFRGHLPRYNHTRKMMRIRPATMPTPIKRCAPRFSAKDGSKPVLSEEQEAYVVEHEFAALRMIMGAIVRRILQPLLFITPFTHQFVWN